MTFPVASVEMGRRDREATQGTQAVFIKETSL